MEPDAAGPVYSPACIIMRPDDLVFLAVGFDGFTLDTRFPPAGQTGTLTAADLAYITVTFPIQTMFEQRLPSGTPWPSDGLVDVGWGGDHPSSIKIPVAQGTTIPLTVDAILTFIASQPFSKPITPTPPFGEVGRSEANLPAGLVLAPVPVHPADDVTAQYPIQPRRNGDTTALWQLDVTAPSGLLGLPTATFDDFEGQTPGTLPENVASLNPLFYKDRQTILAGAQTSSLPRIDRLRLSALGGTLTAAGAITATGAAPNLTWQYDLALGRDHRVHTAQRGVLLPFGHTAILDTVAERNVETFADAGLALMRTRTTLMIDPIVDFDPAAPQARAFPFTRVQVLTPTINDLDLLEPTGSPASVLVTHNHGEPVQVAVRLFGTQGPVDVTTQMVFQQFPPPAGSTPPGPRALDVGVDISVPPIAVPAARIDLVRAVAPDPADVHLVHRITMAAGQVTQGVDYWPQIARLHVDLPAVRTLLPPGVNSLIDAKLSQDLIDRGEQAVAVLDDINTILNPDDPDSPGAMAKNLLVSFENSPATSGALINPSMVADSVARQYGPMANSLVDSATGALPDMSSIFADAKLLGLKLSDLLPTALTDLPLPKIVEAARDAQAIASGTPPTVEMSWTGLKPIGKKSLLAGVVDYDTSLTVDALVSPTTSSVTCTLTQFGMALPDHTNALLKVNFTALTFTAVKGSPPKLAATGVKMSFEGALNLIAELASAVDFGHAGSDAADTADDIGQVVKATADGITVSYAVSVPELPTAAGFDLRHIDFQAKLSVPFNGDPVSFATNFATRDNPFTVAVLAFGGGGYVDLLVDGTGLQHFEGSLDFGAQLAVNFVVANGEVHAFGGVRFDIARVSTGSSTDISVTAFLRFGGSLQVLGVVSVSVEVSIELTYDGHVLSGRATLVIDVDISIWSDSVELDTGTWVIAGHEPAPMHPLAIRPADDADQLAGWQAYREAFAA